MKRKFPITLLALFLLLCSQGQEVVIRGVVSDNSNNTPVTAASVYIKGTGTGVITGEEGSFVLRSPIPLPVIVSVTCVGYLPAEITVTDTAILRIGLTQMIISGGEVVIAATRLPTSLLRSPVSIEKITTADIRNAATPSYYDLITNLKGVDVTTSSLTYKTFSTRGFNLSGSPRVNQIVDGMDNQSPGLNFAIGSSAGLTDPDVAGIEVLPGASSVLYGPGGTNGTIVIYSKDPFTYPGISIVARQGITHIDKKYREQPGGFTDLSFRAAGVIRNKLGYKITGQFTRAIDWVANDTSNYLRTGDFGKVIPGTRQTDPNYDGVNVYGDETSVDIRNFLAAYLPPGHPLLANPLPVSRTGYREQEFVDPVTSNKKLNGGLYYRFAEHWEASLSAYLAGGQTIYTGSNRFVFTDIRLDQYKAELHFPGGYLRSYTTRSDAGNTYSATTAMQILNEAWKPSFDPANIPGSWYPQYTGAFLAALNAGLSEADAHKTARAFADQGRPMAGSPGFGQIFESVRKTPIPGGGLFIDKSSVWYAEGQFDFADRIPFANVLVGANYKKSLLDSRGTIFIDTTGKLQVSQWGAFVQATRKLADDTWAISVAGRYDKNENFEGRFTPRFTVVFTPAKNHNIRASYQTAYRFPTNTDLFLRLNIGSGVFLLGGLPWIQDYMQTDQYPAYKIQANGIPESTPYQYQGLQPETSRSFEIGYKGLIRNRLLVDVYYYFAGYDNFVGRNILYQPATNRSYSIITNSGGKVQTYGWGVGADYQLYKRYVLKFALYSDVITRIPTSFIGGFNTPGYRVASGISNTGMGKHERWAMNVTLRWQDSFLYERDFATGEVDAFSTIDAQLSYKLPQVKTVIKLGGTNILNHYYQNAFGNPMIGGLYYLSLAYNL